MSRCFPYPPPGYEKKVGDAGLIESIKLQKESEKAKKERRKEKKREKKEKKHKSRDDGKTDEKKKHGSEKRHKNDSGPVNQKREGEYKERRDEEIEQLERSSISEELGQPSSTQSFYVSSESIRGSGKRKKPDAPTDTCCNQLGSVLRIRLPLSKHKDPELPSKELEACTSGRAEIPAKEPHTSGRAQIRAKEPHTSGRVQIPAKEPHTSGRAEIPAKEPNTSGRAQIPAKEPNTSGRAQIPAKERHTSGRAQIPVKEPPKTAHEYINAGDLMESWNPIPLHTERPDFDSLEWLFESREQCREPAKRWKASSSSSHVSGAGLGPRACYLPAADVYALPYVLPF